MLELSFAQNLNLFPNSNIDTVLVYTNLFCHIFMLSLFWYLGNNGYGAKSLKEDSHKEWQEQDANK